MSLSCSVTMYSHKSIKMKYVPFTRVWHNFVFIRKPVEFSLGTALRSVGMNVGGKTACFMLFPPWVPCTVSFLGSCCQLYSGAVPCMCLCLLTYTLSAPRPAASLGRSQSSIDWKWMAGCVASLCALAALTSISWFSLQQVSDCFIRK